MIELTSQEAKLLRWIADNRITRAEWRRNGKKAYGPSHLWIQHRLGSADSEITVSDEVQRSCRKFVEIGPIGVSLFVLNEQGIAALDRYTRAA